MKQYLFLGDSITDADHLFDPANLGYGYVSLLARRPEYALILLILSRRTHSSDRQLARKESMRSRPTGFI